VLRLRGGGSGKEVLLLALSISSGRPLLLPPLLVLLPLLAPLCPLPRPPRPIPPPCSGSASKVHPRPANGFPPSLPPPLLLFPLPWQRPADLRGTPARQARRRAAAGPLPAVASQGHEVAVARPRQDLSISFRNDVSGACAGGCAAGPPTPGRGTPPSPAA